MSGGEKFYPGLEALKGIEFFLSGLLKMATQLTNNARHTSAQITEHWGEDQTVSRLRGKVMETLGEFTGFLEAQLGNDIDTLASWLEYIRWVLKIISQRTKRTEHLFEFSQEEKKGLLVIGRRLIGELIQLMDSGQAVEASYLNSEGMIVVCFDTAEGECIFLYIFPKLSSFSNRHQSEQYLSVGDVVEVWMVRPGNGVNLALRSAKRVDLPQWKVFPVYICGETAVDDRFCEQLQSLGEFAQRVIEIDEEKD